MLCRFSYIESCYTMLVQLYRDLLHYVGSVIQRPAMLCRFSYIESCYTMLVQLYRGLLHYVGSVI